ncbi:unnamed protein product [Kuraishia capsulata CBS 1993]|uniref:Uncharacterized protein n=1 Tax=Kuraishia capsulata CBS 1993 TaxID=1382522 RepID=W6MNM6_9ASCO|nr:uncharacterized protein KUCA_T00004218001 [Kuraishia capsulata CBS 1993]CDK28236.1 unnamed protein product [Kuraishia capsulata CBS 1993]
MDGASGLNLLMSEYFSGDPREIVSADEFDAFNSDESADEREILKMEAALKQKRELLMKKKMEKIAVPEDTRVMVPGSPKKNKIEQRPASTAYFEERKAEEALKERIRQDSLQRQQSKASSFADRFIQNKNIKIKETQKQKEIMISRVYSFSPGQSLESVTETVDERETYSGINISKRYVKASGVDEAMKGKKIMRVDKLLAEVCPPDYVQPSYPNWVLLGIVISKAEAKNTSDNKSRYVTIHISNFKQKVALVLMGKAVEKYFKLRMGDVIAVLNPTVWPWKEKSITSGEVKSGFSVSLKEDYDSILEIGKARDFAFCSAKSRDGVQCKTAIDTSRTDVCDFHRERVLKKTTARRMEFNTTSGVLPPKMNGQTQHMYMSTSKKNGGLKGQLIGDSFLTGTTSRVVSASDDPNSAFYRENYQSSSLISDAKRDLRIAQAKKKERELQRKLMDMTGGHSLRDENLETTEERQLKVKAKNVAYPSTALNKIGFNPTRRVFDSRKSNKGKPESNIVYELKKEISTTKVLTPTEDAVLKRKQSWKQRMADLKRSKQPIVKAPVKEVFSSDDSDLEIEPPVDPTQLAQYIKITGS